MTRRARARPVRDFAIAATLHTLEDLCRRRLKGDDVMLGEVQAVNLGLAAHERLTPKLRGLLRDTGWRVIVHMIDLNLSGQLDMAILADLKKATRDLDVEWFEEDLGIWTWGRLALGVHHLPPFLDQESVRDTAANIRTCSEVLERPLCVENPPTYFALGDMEMWEFMACVAEEADCGLVLDTGHMIGFDVCTEKPVSRPRGKAWRGWNRVRELHVSGFQSVQLAGLPVWIDHHPEPVCEPQINWILQTLPCLAPSALICLEMDGASPTAIADVHARLVHGMASA